MDKRIAGIARGSSELASKQGITLDTSDAKALVTQAISNGDIPKATGVRLYQQINNLGNDPLKIHDWVQEVNVKYGNRFNNGTIDDTATSKLANGIAQKFRNSLDTVVDRTGYAEAYANNQALKKALVQIAKKANKNVSFGDIGTEAGLDAAISIITGNPEYMLRTVGSGIFKGILSKIRNQSGFNSFKKAANISSKLGTKTKLPKFGIKENYNSIPKSSPDINPNTNGINIDNTITKKVIPTVSNTTENKASIPVMMTNKLRSDLKNLGYTADDIANLKPIEANKIVNEGIKPKTTIIEVKQPVKETVSNDFTYEPIKETKKPILNVKSSIEKQAEKYAQSVDPNYEMADRPDLTKGAKAYKEKLTELQNDTKSVTKDTPTDLISEAKKYKSGSDFYELSGSKINQQLRDKGIRGKEQVTKYWEELTGKKSVDSYTMSHRPQEMGVGYNIDELGNAPDFYNKPEYFKYSKDGTYDESIRALLKIKGKPEATVTVYRASPKNELNNGDWISLSKKYANGESLSEGTKVHSFKVKAKDIQFAGDDINEFGYFPK